MNFLHTSYKYSLKQNFLGVESIDLLRVLIPFIFTFWVRKSCNNFEAGSSIPSRHINTIKLSASFQGSKAKRNGIFSFLFAL